MICMLMHLFGHRHAAQLPHHGQQSWSAPESARQILDRRYAGGEITREEYERLRQTLDTAGGIR
jgi:uncharacterized membrane protein